ncbi:MAG: 50S ribosomal protein L25 [Planctomycetes bacterium]|nr:50S ribosomal protein L25 [Planctomycetota bacterium]
MAEVLNVELRTALGKRNTRRLRTTGGVPAVLYGHGEDTVHLSVGSEAIATAVRHGSRVVDLEGAVEQKAIILELQWDTWGTDVVHIDFGRVAEGELVRVELPIVLRGVAPGSKQGGIVEHVLHRVEVECPAISVPEKLEVNINHLELEASILASEIKLPEGVTILVDGDTMVVHCVMPLAELEDEDGLGGEAEPEVIGGRKAEDDDTDEGKKK